MRKAVSELWLVEPECVSRAVSGRDVARNLVLRGVSPPRFAGRLTRTLVIRGALDCSTSQSSAGRSCI